MESQHETARVMASSLRSVLEMQETDERTLAQKQRALLFACDLLPAFSDLHADLVDSTVQVLVRDKASLDAGARRLADALGVWAMIRVVRAAYAAAPAAATVSGKDGAAGGAGGGLGALLRKQLARVTGGGDVNDDDSEEKYARSLAEMWGMKTATVLSAAVTHLLAKTELANEDDTIPAWAAVMELAATAGGCAALAIAPGLVNALKTAPTHSVAMSAAITACLRMALRMPTKLQSALLEQVARIFLAASDESLFHVRSACAVILRLHASSAAAGSAFASLRAQYTAHVFHVLAQLAGSPHVGLVRECIALLAVLLVHRPMPSSPLAPSQDTLATLWINAPTNGNARAVLLALAVQSGAADQVCESAQARKAASALAGETNLVAHDQVSLLLVLAGLSDFCFNPNVLRTVLNEVDAPDAGIQQLVMSAIGAALAKNDVDPNKLRPGMHPITVGLVRSQLAHGGTTMMLYIVGLALRCARPSFKPMLLTIVSLVLPGMPVPRTVIGEQLATWAQAVLRERSDAADALAPLLVGLLEGIDGRPSALGTSWILDGLGATAPSYQAVLDLRALDTRDRGRVMFSWITHNISYDLALEQTLEQRAPTDPVPPRPTPDNVLASRKAVCEGFAILTEHMMQRCGAHTVRFASGPVRSNETLRVSDQLHAWCYDTEDGTVLDATWAAGAGSAKLNRWIPRHSPEYYRLAHTYWPALYREMSGEAYTAARGQAEFNAWEQRAVKTVSASLYDITVDVRRPAVATLVVILSNVHPSLVFRPHYNSQQVTHSFTTDRQANGRYSITLQFQPTAQWRREPQRCSVNVGHGGLGLVQRIVSALLSTATDTYFSRTT